MSKKEYRLVERENIANKVNRFFPQVKMPKFGILSIWCKIGKHKNDYGLYPSDDYKFPKSREEAIEICEHYDKWIQIEENTKNIIHPITL
jgi:hypothetical protein